MNQRKQFLEYIHIFRAIAIFFVVAGHCIDMFHWDDSDSISRILRIVISNGTVLFVFIAGYLFQHLSHNFDAKKYYKSKLKNVITPYLIVSIPAILIFVTIMQRDTVWSGFYDNSVPVQVLLFYLTGKHLTPLWFVPMITIFYFCGPLLNDLDKRRWIYFLLPAFIILSCFVDRGGYTFKSFAHFFSVYLFGMFCSQYKEKVNEIIQKRGALIASFIFVVIFIGFEHLFMKGTMTYVNYIQKMFMVVFIMGAAIRFSPYLTSKFVSRVADTSFGVFFIHSYLVTGIKKVHEHFYGQIAEGNVLLYIVSAVLVLLFCVVIISVMQKVLGSKSRLIVGS